MRTLVTGVAGFVGSTLARRLLADGADVVGIDCLTDYYDPALKRANLDTLTGHERFRFVEADLTTADLPALLTDVEIVFHQAGQPGVRKSWGTDFDIYIQCNVAATQRLLEAAATSSSLRRLVYASSSSVYGDAESYPTTEETVPRPMSPYGVTKLAAEHLCTLYAANHGVPTVSLRYFTVYGPGQRPDMAFNRFITSAIGGTPITLFGTGEQIRDFTFIDDIVEANVLAGTGDPPAGAVYNVAGGTRTSVNEVLEELATIAGHPLDITRQGMPPGDVFQTGGTTDSIRGALGWGPRTTLRDGLGRQFQWMLQCSSRAGRTPSGSSGVRS